MKATRGILTGLLLVTGTLTGLYFLHAQETSTPSFFLSVSNVSNGQINFVLQNTSPGLNYVLLQKQNLTEPTWSTVGTVTGASNQTWTAMSAALNGQSRAFFKAMMTAGQPADTNLWLVMPTNVMATPGLLTLEISNTIEGQLYVIQTNSDLADSSLWDMQQQFNGAVGNSTTVQVPMNGPVLYMRAAFGGDSTGSGIPDWWLLKYFGTTSVDVNALDPANDGWTIWEDYENGYTPVIFHTPPAPRGLAANYNSYNNTATISWQPSLGAVTGYILEKYDSYLRTVQDFTIPVGTESYVDDLSSDPPDPLSGNTVNVSYKVQAVYGTHTSYWGGPVPLEQDTLPATFIAGPQGWAYVAVSSVPPGAVALRVTRIDELALEFGFGPYSTNFDIPISASTNGFYLIPSSWDVMQPDAWNSSGYFWYVQTLNTNGTPNANGVLYQGYRFTGDDRGWLVPPYFDGRTQLKQNLIFLLRAGVVDSPFDDTGINTNNGGSIYYFSNPDAYAYAGFYQLDENPNDQMYYENVGSFDAYWPFESNYRYRNFVFSPANLDQNGRMTTGVGGNYAGMSGIFPQNPLQRFYGLYQIFPMAYQFEPPATNGAMISALLATNQAQWVASYALDSANNYLVEIGVTTNGGGVYSMARNARNIYGLPFVSANVGYNAGSSAGVATLYAGNNTTQGGYFYPETAQPQFQTREYDCWQGNLDSDGYFYGNPLPGMTNFSTSQTSDLLIAPVGVSILNDSGYFYPQNEIQINGYAKLAVLNGYPGVYAYLGQYFDQAYEIDDNGNVTTNTTGVLSSYGQFFATQPGPAALVTMPDIDTGERGTCTVYCVSLALDKNHDGSMDLSWNGPDATSPASPMEFWVNDDWDISDPVGDPGHDREGQAKDYNNNFIDSQRDLEDFARLWICGVPVLPSSQGYTVTLSMSAISGSPAINLFRSVEADGGIGYLTQTNVAAAQTAGPLYTGPDWKITTIAPGQSYTFPDDFFDGTNKYFLFEGAGIGKGQLTLTIYQNGNPIAQTSQWLDLHDIEDFYERASIADNTSGAISNWTSTIESWHPATANLCGNDMNLIVFVHGFNVENWDWRNDSDTVLKRLYWAGFNGKFMTVKWPCNSFDWSLLETQTSVFNQSEVKAYKASTALATYLNQLHFRFPGYRLNLYAHSQGNAVVSEAIEQGGVQFDTYILTQGAMPDSAYDVNAPINTTLLNAESSHGTPRWQQMGYLGIYTNLPGRIVNFYNPLDPVLDWWVTDQEKGKPDGYLQNLIVPCAYYTFDGVNGWHHNILGFTDYQVTDPEESRAMISRSLTLPIGQSGPASAHGVIQSAVDLHASFNFADTSFNDHSAQWAWPIQTTRPYFQQVLRSCQIQPAP